MIIEFHIRWAKIRRFWACVALFVSGGTVTAQVKEVAGWAGLIGRSPFQNDGSPTASATSQRGELEFRGYVIEDGIGIFSIFDPSLKKAVWLCAGEMKNGIMVRSFNDQTYTVSAERAGMVVNLPLKQSRTILAPMNVSVEAAGKEPGPPDANAERPEHVAEEVRRRRAARIASIESGDLNLP